MTAVLRAVDDRDEPNGSDADSSAKAVIANRYRLVGRIGKGATGSVYRAYDRTLDRQVAIKLLKPGELVVAEREAQGLAKVAHRNIVTIHDFGQDGGHRYLVLELLEGRDFNAWLRERPTHDEIIQRFIDAGRGLSAAHQAAVVHQDFKPSNVILTNEDRVVVIDFGLARALDSMCSELDSRGWAEGWGEGRGEGWAEGTLAYMAPERLAHHGNDERSDQFSFCVALWEALAGVNPFEGDDPLARYRSIRRGPPPRTRGRSELPRHVAAVLERGMAFERSERFSTMEELLRELERPAPPQRSRGARPLLTAVAVAATFLFAWGLAPESPTVDEAHSNLDPRADAALSILESARKRAVDGDAQTALKDLFTATQLIEQVEEDQLDQYCTFGRSIPELGEIMAKGGHFAEARMAFAVAGSFAPSCGMPEDDIRARAEAVRARSWEDERFLAPTPEG